MGPALERVFAALGATLITDLRAPGAQIDLAAQIVADAGQVDVLIASERCRTKMNGAAFSGIWVDPLPRLVRAVLPQMRARRNGRIVVIGSAAALRGMKRTSTYSAHAAHSSRGCAPQGSNSRARHPTERDRAELCR